MAIELVLERHDDQIKGCYTFGLGFGTVDGTVEGNKLYFDWKWADSYGQRVFEGLDDDSFTGTWGYREDRSGAGTWTGRRSTGPE